MFGAPPPPPPPPPRPLAPGQWPPMSLELKSHRSTPNRHDCPLVQLAPRWQAPRVHATVNSKRKVFKVPYWELITASKGSGNLLLFCSNISSENIYILRNTLRKFLITRGR
jgi:hypothetical protein